MSPYEPLTPEDVRAEVYRVADVLRAAQRPFATALVVEAAVRLPLGRLNREVCVLRGRFPEGADTKGAQQFANQLGHLLDRSEVPVIALPQPPGGGHRYFAGILRRLGKKLDKPARGMLADMVKAPYPWYAYLAHLHKGQLARGLDLETATRELLKVWAWYNRMVVPAVKAQPIRVRAETTYPPAFATVMDGVKPCREKRSKS
ncbi:hypothetical protein [Oceanithermus sp.]|uniref:hypothetical protein n=1 Tax=Oceanithermus sp. TaxID=2268145 RepID=UPI00257DBA96|nr:hypothetical protein [Oceanithermus sp.]